MRTTTFSVAALSLLQIANAQPHRHGQHQAQHAKKDVVTVYTTHYAQPTEGAQVIVYVNEDGSPFSTSTIEAVAAQTPVPAYVAPAVSKAAGVAVSVAQVVASYATPIIAPSVAPVKSSAAAAAPAQSSTAASTSSGTGYGLTYSPYNSDGTCKSASQVAQDFSHFGSGFSYIRVYGVDCNTMTTVLASCKSNGLKLWAGIFDISQLSSAVSTISAAASSDWSAIYAVSVGNELVNSGSASASSVVAAIGSARTQLRAAGYTGPVVTTDTLVATRSNPSLCDASDFCAVNCHPFFDGTIVAANSGSFLTDSVASLAKVLANKNQRIVISETGWPSQGDSNGVAVPSTSNQAAAVSAIKSTYASNPANVVLFNPYNTHWKKSSPAQFNAEPWWGFMGECPSG